MRYTGQSLVVASAIGLSASVLCPGVGHAQVSTTYTYDALGRLKTVTTAGGATVTYAYDAAGNRSQVVVAGVQAGPTAFDLGSPAAGAAAGAWILSAAPVVSGFTGAVAVSVTGGQYRINGGAWQTAAGAVSAGQSVQVQVQAPTTPGASQTATLTIGGVTDTFQVTTAAADTTPNAYDLGNPVTAASGAWSTSNTVTIAGIDAATVVSITGGQYRINGGAWQTTAGTVSAGQTIQVQVQAPTTAGASQTATLTVGGVSDTFQVQAASVDVSPVDWDNGHFETNANIGAGATGYRTISGIEAAVTLRADLQNITGQGYNLADGGDFYIESATRGRLASTPWRNGGSVSAVVQPGEQIGFYTDAFTSQGRKQYGFDVQVYNATTGAFIDHHYQSGILDADNNYNVADTTPDVYDLGGPLTGISGGWSTSNTVTVAGINAAAQVSITGGQYRINGGAWTSASGTISSGQTIQVRAQAPTTGGASQTATLTVGGVTDTFQVRTASVDVSPVDWNNGHFETNDNIGAGATSYRTISGIEAAVTLRADIENITGQGYNLADGGDFYIESASRGRLASTPWRNGGSVSAVVQPGEQIHFYTDAFTTQGRKQFGFDVQVYNATTGAFIDHHYQSGILDADNNWNYSAAVTISSSNIYAYESVVRAGRPVTASGSTTFTVTGGSGSWTAAVELQNVSGTTPTTSVSGTTAYVRISSAGTRLSSGQYRVRVTDANGTVSYSPWGNFTLEIEGGTGGGVES
jgi:YD repeat-containing protein